MVHFGELWLRGKNRGQYIKRLACNISSSLSGLDFSIATKYDRLLISIKSDQVAEAKKRLGSVFGISNYELAYTAEPSIESIVNASIGLAESANAKSIKIIAHRSDKTLGFDSNTITEQIAKKAESVGILPVLHGFELPIYVNVTKEAAYISTEKLNGLGGLPVGSEGKCVVLLSGGIDSPVASWFAMKRGLEPIYLHVHAFRTNEEAVKSSKISSIVEALSAYYKGSKVYYVPSYLFDASALAARLNRYSLVMLKNFMLRLAQAIAKKEGASCIVTGESLGQVASQTAENMLAESYGIKTLVIRPLVGFDKQEIIGIAKKIGTYEQSIKPYKDVCSISSRNPKTKCKTEEVKELSRKIGISSIVAKSLKLAQAIEQ